MLMAAIMDVDGMLLASPHERAWREALEGIAEPVGFTAAIYQATVAGKPRAADTVAALDAVGVPNAAARAADYAATKPALTERHVLEAAP